jgi:hypothetical protein
MRCDAAAAHHRIIEDEGESLRAGRRHRAQGKISRFPFADSRLGCCHSNEFEVLNAERRLGDSEAEPKRVYRKKVCSDSDTVCESRNGDVKMEMEIWSLRWSDVILIDDNRGSGWLLGATGELAAGLIEKSVVGS